MRLRISRALRCAILLTFALVLLCVAADAAEIKPADRFPRETLADSAGGNLDLEAARGRSATVLVCMSVDCPISNEFMPTLVRLAEQFKPRGVNFVGINPEAGTSLAEMADHARQLQLSFPFLKDEQGDVSRKLQFKVTPEVFVFNSAGALVYRGRIDDRYRALGGAAPTPDLQVALEELLAGKPISMSQTKAVGCPIQAMPSKKSAPAAKS